MCELEHWWTDKDTNWRQSSYRDHPMFNRTINFLDYSVHHKYHVVKYFLLSEYIVIRYRGLVQCTIHKHISSLQQCNQRDRCKTSAIVIWSPPSLCWSCWLRHPSPHIERGFCCRDIHKVMFAKTIKSVYKILTELQNFLLRPKGMKSIDNKVRRSVSCYQIIITIRKLKMMLLLWAPSPWWRCWNSKALDG